jgi:predicted nucleic acid-binding protein
VNSSLRFIDANVFVHAYLRHRRPLKPGEEKVKAAAKRIVTRVNEGERVLTTVVHVGEVANLVEDYLPLPEALSLERALCLRENMELAPVTRPDYIAALDLAQEHKISLNDAVAYVAMRRRDVVEVYSFDHDFDRLRQVRRLQA